MKQASAFLAILFLLTSCQQNPFTTTCYEVTRIRGGRTTVIAISVTTDGNQAHGTQSTTVTDENGKTVAKATGDFKGSCLDGACLVDYHYESEGEARVAELEFKVEDDKLFMTAGSYRMEDGKEVMKERGLFNVPLEKISCP